MVTLAISEAVKEQAAVYANQRWKYEYNRFGFAGDRRKDMILLGSVGELMFQQHLEINNVKYDFEFQAGKYDDMDFKIGYDIIEIKTSGYTNSFNHLNLLYSESQFVAANVKNFKYCVQVFVNGLCQETKKIKYRDINTAHIAGYISFRDMENYKQLPKWHGDDYKIPLKNLKNIENLLKRPKMYRI
jgi:hypothetical protein